jgi:hypothetical protein
VQHAVAAEVGSGSSRAVEQQRSKLLPLSSSSWWQQGPIKVTFALKPQLALLAEPPAGSGLPGFRVCEPCVDVRIALWCLKPESQSVREGAWAGTTGCR